MGSARTTLPRVAETALYGVFGLGFDGVPDHLAAVVRLTDDHISRVPVISISSDLAPSRRASLDGAIFQEISIPVRAERTNDNADCVVIGVIHIARAQKDQPLPRHGRNQAVCHPGCATCLCLLRGRVR